MDMLGVEVTGSQNFQLYESFLVLFSFPKNCIINQRWMKTDEHSCVCVSSVF